MKTTTATRSKLPFIHWLEPLWFWKIVGFFRPSFLGKMVVDLNFYERWYNPKTNKYYLVDKSDNAIAETNGSIR